MAMGRRPMEAVFLSVTDPFAFTANLIIVDQIVTLGYTPSWAAASLHSDARCS